MTVRLDPKLNYLCELAARAQRRTKSSFIEWAIEHALHSATVPGTAHDYGSSDLSMNDLAGRLWDTDEPDRLAALGLHAPVLLTHEEQIVWKLIRTSGWFWRGRWARDGEWEFSPTQESDLITEWVREQWEEIKAVAEGAKPRSQAPFLNPMRKSESIGSGQIEKGGGFPVDDLDDDTPF